jgi:soluble lytic murein transglycosylase
LPAPPRLPQPAIPERLAAERRWRAAAELRRLDLAPQAAAEIGSLVPGYTDDRAALIGLGRLLYELGDYSRSLGVLRNYFGDVLERGGDEVPLEFWEQAYPVKLIRDIRERLVDGSADPYLVASVMREESAFDRAAISKVGAIGLMQLMPYTAEWVAKQIGFGDYSRERLFEAETSIRLGGWYLGHLGREFSGDSILTIASYNAGPEAVAQWLPNRPDEMDEFIESIPFAETRNFTKRVLRSLREFRRVDALSLARNLPSDSPL